METILVNGVDITNLVTYFESYDETGQDHIIGNAVSTQIKLKLKNKDNQLNGLLDYPFIIGSKAYLIYKKPEKWTKTISVTLYDYMMLSNVNYVSQLNYSENVTISAQLDEIAQLIDVSIEKNTLSQEVLNKKVGWYDSSEIVRNYLGYIAECDGKNAFVENNKIVFRSLAYDTHSIDFSSGYDLSEYITIKRVCLETGVGEPLARGEKTGKTLYLNPENSYLEQSDINRIYDKYKDISFYTFPTFKCLSDVNIKLTDLVEYHGITIMPLGIKRTVNGGLAKDSLELSGNLTIKNADEVIVKGNVNTKIKRIKTTLDQNEAQLKIIAQKTDENAQKITDMEIAIDGFKVATDKIEELETKVGLTYWIESSVGYMLDESVEELATLTAHIYIEDVEQDVDGELYYSWYKVDYEGNESHLGQGKSIEVYTSLLGGCNVYFTASTKDGETFYFTDEHGNVLTDENGNVFTYQ